ncbi:MAG: hypothetical protein ABIQ53_14280 [Terracoccus sp.]
MRLTKVTPGDAQLSGRTFLPADSVLGTIGQRPVAWPGFVARMCDDHGRWFTASDLSVCEGVWAAVDAAHVLADLTREPSCRGLLGLLGAAALTGQMSNRRAHASVTQA